MSLPKATPGRAFLANVLGRIAGSVAGNILSAILISVGVPTSGADPAGALAVGLAGWAVGVAGFVPVVMFFFKTTFGKAVLAWLPTIPTMLVAAALLVTTLMPTLGRARETALSTTCQTSVKQIWSYYSMDVEPRVNSQPQRLDALLERRGVPRDILHCPSARRMQRTCDYFLHAPTGVPHPDTLLACDLSGNHRGDVRHVVYASGWATHLTIAEFRAELAKPVNAEFAVRLKAAQASLPPSPAD